MSEWKSVDSNDATPIFDICPHCLEKVSLLPIDKDSKDIEFDYGECTNHDYEATHKGFRKCSNPDCEKIIIIEYNFTADPVGYDHFGEIEYNAKISKLSLIPEIDKCIYLDYIPENIAKTFIEAQKCFYNECYIASAIMIRKILEEICENYGISKGLLGKKIELLLSSNKLPKEIGEEFIDLKLLGNDGAHTELKDFKNVGKEEVGTALDVISEALRIIYEPKLEKYKSAVKKLKSFKK
jgi:hypothetical protein